MGLRYWVSNNLPNNAGAGGLWHISSKNLEDNSVQASKKISAGRAIPKGLEAGEEWLKARMVGARVTGGRFHGRCEILYMLHIPPPPYTEPDDNSCPLVLTELLYRLLLKSERGNYPTQEDGKIQEIVYGLRKDN